jgi:AcrR family transcriptional regulator
MALIEEKKNYHHGHLKEQLLEAVRQLVEEKGPDSFSIAEACRRAGVSTAAPYKHFKDRDEILHGVVLSAMHRMGAAMQKAAERAPARRPRKDRRPRQGLYRLRESRAGRLRPDVRPDRKPCRRPRPDRGRTGQVRDRLPRRGRASAPAARSSRGGARAYALWCAVHGHAFLVLDGKADKTKISVDEDAYLRLVGQCLPAPGRRPRLIRWGRGWSVFPCSGDLYGASRDRTHDRWRALRDRQPRRD